MRAHTVLFVPFGASRVFPAGIEDLAAGELRRQGRTASKLVTASSKGRIRGKHADEALRNPLRSHALEEQIRNLARHPRRGTRIQGLIVRKHGDVG